MQRLSDNRGISTDMILVSLAVVAVIGAGIALYSTGGMSVVGADSPTAEQPSGGNESENSTTVSAPDVETKEQLMRGFLNSVRLNSDVEIEVVNISSQGQRVLVRHTLAEGFTREETIGIMLGVYEHTWNMTRDNGEEWRVQRIEGEIVGAAGETVVEYHVRSVWLEDLYQDRISRVTFSEQVMETVSETELS